MAKETDKRWKGAVIDYQKISEMDNSEYQLKPLNQQQVAVLLMLLQYQKWSTRWINLQISKAELLRFIAEIEHRLMQSEGMSMGTKEDFRDGMYEAMNRLALQIASGTYSNLSFTTDADGVVTPTNPTDTPPEDDPTTPIDETKSARMGGTLQVAYAVEKVWDKVDALFGIPSGAVTPATPLLDAQTIMKQLYVCDAVLMDTAVADYYAWRLAGATQIGFDSYKILGSYMFCNGYDYESIVAWVLDSSGWILSKSLIALKFVESLGDAFFSTAYAKGIGVPSTLYLDAACVPSPLETFNMPLLGNSYYSQTSFKPKHRLLFTIEGYFTSVDGAQRDFWYHTDNTGFRQFGASTVNMQLGDGITKPTINQVPYSSSHKYQFTIDTPVVNGGNLQISATTYGMSGTITPSVSGQGFKVTIEDLGEYA